MASRELLDNMSRETSRPVKEDGSNETPETVAVATSVVTSSISSIGGIVFGSKDHLIALNKATSSSRMTIDLVNTSQTLEISDSMLCWTYSREVTDIRPEHNIWMPYQRLLECTPALFRPHAAIPSKFHLRQGTRGAEVGKFGRYLCPQVEIRAVPDYKRPTVVYRAVHSNYRANGRIARGSCVPVNAFNFQTHVENHLAWPCKRKSPFMSVTPSLHKALDFCKSFHDRGKQNIRVLVIDISKEDETKLIWSVKDLVTSLGLTWEQYYEEEFLMMFNLPRRYIKRYRFDPVGKILAETCLAESTNDTPSSLENGDQAVSGRAHRPKRGHSFIWIRAKRPLLLSPAGVPPSKQTKVPAGPSETSPSTVPSLLTTLSTLY